MVDFNHPTIFDLTRADGQLTQRQAGYDGKAHRCGELKRLAVISRHTVGSPRRSHS